jgi:hypothetical protein
MMIVFLEDRLMSAGPAILKGWAVGNLQHSPQRRAGWNSSNSRNVAPANSPGLRYRASIARPKSGAYGPAHVLTELVGTYEAGLMSRMVR